MHAINNNHILFHDLKHHILSGILWLQQKEVPEKCTLKQLKRIGASQLDYYTGKLNITEIKNEVRNILQEKGISEKTSYKNWLRENREYAQIIY